MTKIEPDPATGAWRKELGHRLVEGENVLAALPVDLDASLRFGQGWLVVTNRRLLGRMPGAEPWSEWTLTSGLSLQLAEQSGVGTVELGNGERLLARWHYTLAHQREAQRLVQRFGQQVESLAHGTPLPAPERACERCDLPLEPDEEECPRCTPEPESTSPRPGRCCVCGALPGPTAGSCWPASC